MGFDGVMDKWQAIHNFWSGFGLPAYDENSVPDNAVLPYITYSASTSDFENIVPLSASVWYRSTSWVGISNKVDEISNSINGYVLVPLNNHEYMFLVKGTPFAQRMADPDGSIKRVYINITAEFFAEK